MSTIDLARAGALLASLAAMAPLQAADISNGRQLYNLHCASCHGPSGISVMPAAPSVARPGTLMQPDMALLNSIRSGKNAMPAYMGILKDREIFDVIAYMRTLRQ